MTPATASAPPRPSVLARFGPLAAVLVAIALVAVLASTGRNDTSTTASGASQAGGGSRADTRNPDLPITWAEADKAGTTGRYDWGDDCDPETGRVKIPSKYAPPCVVARPGVKGGATSQGVTDNEIKVVYYEFADDDIAASLQSKLDPVAVRQEAGEKLTRMLEARFELWGRKIKIVRLKGSGSDETSARADAVKVASEIGAFASLGGPAQEGAYADELSSRGVICIGCGLAVPDSTFQRNAPYMWGNSMTAEQFLPILGDYTIKRLFKRKASFAGDPAMRTRTRVFGAVHFEQDPPVFEATEKAVAAEGAKVGYKSAVTLTYQLVIPELAQKARTLIARLKEAKVTTVIFLGDPLMPIYLTKAATDQDYFPEWVITGTVLTDTTVLGRLYDPKQWAHAFGVSPLPAAQPREDRDAWALYQWFYGKAPAAVKTVGVVYPPIQLLMIGVHLAGPNLTPETFRDGLFGYPPSGGTPTSPQYSFGEHGFFDAPDFNSVDDMTEIWWDAKAHGLDEQGVEGDGMVRYADGGKRFKAGEQPAGPPRAFRKKGSVLIYDEVPAADVAPEYPSPAKGN